MYLPQPIAEADCATRVNEFIATDRFKNKCRFKGHARKGQLINTEFLSQNKQINSPMKAFMDANIPPAI